MRFVACLGVDFRLDFEFYYLPSQVRISAIQKSVMDFICRPHIKYSLGICYALDLKQRLPCQLVARSKYTVSPSTHASCHLQLRMALTTAGPLVAGAPKPPLAATPQAQPRRSTLVRKRGDDAVDSSSPASPSKKARVAFNSDVEVKVMEPWGSAPAQVRDEVRRALERHARGEKWEYESLKDIYAENDEPVSSTALRSYTVAIASHASKLGKAHRGLVTAMLHSDWITSDAQYLALFQRFLGNLASTQGIWLADIMGFLVDTFKQCMVPPIRG